jgi:hypothetical protein
MKHQSVDPEWLWLDARLRAMAAAIARHRAQAGEIIRSTRFQRWRTEWDRHADRWQVLMDSEHETEAEVCG